MCSLEAELSAGSDKARPAEPGLTPASFECITGVDLCALPPGTEVVVDTRNSRYRFVVTDPRGPDVMVEGGRHFPRQAAARITGSILNGDPLAVGWIGLGSCIAIFSDCRRTVTSRVRSIEISPSRREAPISVGTGVSE
jgi:hypothetical protein